MEEERRKLLQLIEHYADSRNMPAMRKCQRELAELDRTAKGVVEHELGPAGGQIENNRTHEQNQGGTT